MGDNTAGESDPPAERHHAPAGHTTGPLHAGNPLSTHHSKTMIRDINTHDASAYARPRWPYHDGLEVTANGG